MNVTLTSKTFLRPTIAKLIILLETKYNLFPSINLGTVYAGIYSFCVT